MTDKILGDPNAITCFGFLFILLFVLSFSISIYFLIKTLSWSKTIGKIIGSTGLDTDDGYARIKVVYQYNVNQKTYSSEIIKSFKYDAPTIPSWYYEYQAGTVIIVFFNPDRPSESILSKKESMVGIVIFLFATIILCLMQFKLLSLCNGQSFIETLRAF